MADNFTGAVPPLGTTGLGTNLVTLAYDKLVEKNLRKQPQFRAIVDKKVGSQTHNGSSIRFQFHNDIADTSISSARLEETVDPDAISMPATSYVDVTEDEFGRVVIPTRKLSLMSLADVEPWIANAIAFNMAKTLDDGVRLELDSTANLLVNTTTGGASPTTGVEGIYNNFGVNGGDGTSTASSGMSGEAIRTATTQFRATAVAPRFGAFYVGYIHPEVSHQLRTETGANTWRTPHDYQDASALIAGELGSWEGVRFIETPNVTSMLDPLSSGKIFNSYIVGAQAVAEAVWKEPKIEFGNVTDKLNRFRPVGWHGILNWNLYRPQSLIKIQSVK